MSNRGTVDVRKEAMATSAAHGTSTIRLVALVLLPFVTGYVLSYYFRTVNAVLSSRLMTELGLSAAQLGLMTSAYFLTAASAQLPFGWALDRYGPRRVQMCSLAVASAGAGLFASATDTTMLFASRALIGLGVASALLAGLKAIAMVCPPARLGLFNGVYMCIGALGAVAASAPTEHLLQVIHWRDLFFALALACLAAAALIALVVPIDAASIPTSSSPEQQLSYRQIFSDPYFWRLAPLSAAAIGGAWALQGLWSAPWLRDVGHLTPPEIARYLLIMAVALSVGALSFGIILQRLRTLGVPPAGIMAVASLVYVLAEIALALGWPFPPLVGWCVVSAFAAGTVLTYTMSAQHFPTGSVGRANSAFNLLHFVVAFGVQSLFGTLVAQWPRDALGRYPSEAYQLPMLGLATFQLMALLWFLRPDRMKHGAPSLAGGSAFALPRAATWALLLCVGYRGLAPLQARMGGAIQALLAPHVTAIVDRSAASPVATLEKRLSALETLLQDRDAELAELRRELGRLKGSERAGQHRAQELATSLTYLHEGVGTLLDRIEQLERR